MRKFSRYQARNLSEILPNTENAKNIDISVEHRRASVDMSTDMSVEMSTDISVEGFVNYT